MMRAAEPSWAPARPSKVNVTMPREAIAGDLSVGCHSQPPDALSCGGTQHAFNRCRRSRADPAAGGRVERVGAQLLERCQTERIDRRLGDDDAARNTLPARKPEQRLATTRQRAFVVRPADLDMADGVIGSAVSEPGAATIALADRVLISRRLQHGVRQAACLGQVPPGGRARMQPRTAMPPLLERTIRVPPPLFPQRRGKAWRNAHQAAQDLADLTEVQAWIEVLHEVEHVALGSAPGVPPAEPIVIDNQDRAVVAPLFERASRALFRVEFPSWDDAL